MHEILIGVLWIASVFLAALVLLRVNKYIVDRKIKRDKDAVNAEAVRLKQEELGAPFGRMSYKQSTQDFTDSYDSWTETTRTLANYKASDILSSELGGDLHAPALDIDYDAKLVPSSTEGHYHLLLNKKVKWRDYKRLLKALAKAGLIEQGFADVSIKRKATHLRQPWVKK